MALARLTLEQLVLTLARLDLSLAWLILALTQLPLALVAWDAVRRSGISLPGT